MSSIGILGAGTWGVALARSLALNGHDVTVWSALPEEIDQLRETRIQRNLPGVTLPESILFEKSLEAACAGRDVIVFAVPSVFVRQTARQARPWIPDGQIVVDVAKGIEPETFLTLTAVIDSELSGDGAHGRVRLVALSGPTHAEEVARDMPTAIVAASPDVKAAERVQQIFSSDHLRVYTNDDMKGVELCGALKNVIALCAGISAGLGFGDNAKAALITRGMAEIARLGSAMGCRAETFAGLAGIGDLVVTATSPHSRNNRAGIMIGQGVPPMEAVKRVGMVVEGVNALPAATGLAKLYKVEMPLVDAVEAVVNGGADPRATAQALMGREMKNETGLQSFGDGYRSGRDGDR